VGRKTATVAALMTAAIALSACGDSPLLSLGERSSGWINEPEVVTTTLPPTTVPLIVDSSILQWSNQGIVALNLDDPEALIAEVFQRREGDRYIQASPVEISTVLPGVSFPAVVPASAEWVSSQLIIENDGTLSDDPSAAFGIWSAEPYTRSRSVAQIATLTVSTDTETAIQVAEGAEEISCAKFSDQTTLQCETLDMEGRPVWRLLSSSGDKFVWFDALRRYELFGRSFIPNQALNQMVSQLTSLEELVPAGSSADVANS